MVRVYDRIHDILKRSGLDILTKETTAETDFPDLYRQAQERGQSMLDQVGAIVIEGTTPDPDVGYLVAYAIAQKRPLLLLLDHAHSRQHPIEKFGQRHALPPTLIVSPYHWKTLETLIIAFLKKLDDIEYLEVPSIKFTLRITPQIERYLHWKTHNTNLSKADFLRQLLLDEVIAKDEGYQRYRRKRSSETPPKDQA